MEYLEDIIKELEVCGTVKLRPIGGSMSGRIESGQMVTLIKTSPNQLVLDDIVLVRWNKKYILLKIKEIKKGQALIGNNHGKEEL